MENQPAKLVRILSMKMSCCERCPERLKKKLLKMNGVDSVSVDTERDVVLVTGTIDPTTLLKDVARLGKTVELLYPRTVDEKHTKTNIEKDQNVRHVEEINNKNSHVKEEHIDINDKSNQHRDLHVEENHHWEEEHYQCPQPDNTTKFPNVPMGKKHRNPRFRDGVRKKKQEELYQKEKEEEHKCEDYVPVKYDERVCRDYWCKSHPLSRKIIDRVPAEDTPLFGGFFPFHSGFGFGGANPYNYYPGLYEDPRFGHYQPSRMMSGSRMLPGAFNLH